MGLFDKIRGWPRKKGTMTLQAVVIRADGTREDLGVISHTQLPDWKAGS